MSETPEGLYNTQLCYIIREHFHIYFTSFHFTGRYELAPDVWRHSSVGSLAIVYLLASRMYTTGLGRCSENGHAISKI